MASTLTCHAGEFLTFPVECVCCGQPPAAIVTVEAARSIDLVLFHHSTSFDVTVPVCRRHWTLRKLLGFSSALVLVIATFGGGMYAIANAPPLQRAPIVTAVLVMIAVMILYVRNWHSRLMDRWLLGVSAGRLQADGTFPLWLRREELAGRLTYQVEPRKYVESAGYATHEERTWQQFASWWGKCLIGLLLMLAAWFIWSDLTEFEAGGRRAIHLPAILLAIYNLAGKWPTSLVFGVPGIGLFAWGIGQLVREKSAP